MNNNHAPKTPFSLTESRVVPGMVSMGGSSLIPRVVGGLGVGQKLKALEYLSGGDLEVVIQEREEALMNASRRVIKRIMKDASVMRESDRIMALGKIADDCEMTKEERFELYKVGVSSFPELTKCMQWITGERQPDATVALTAAERRSRGAHNMRWQIKRIKVDFSVYQAHDALIAMGFMKTGTDEDGDSFKTAIGQGLSYGHNTKRLRTEYPERPIWYDDTIVELFGLIKLELSMD